MIEPTEIRLRRAERLVEISFADGTHYTLPAEYLRVESPSAEVQGHGPGEKILVDGKREVAVTGIEPVGTYAVRLIFSDGHSTGIYSFDLLHRLGREQEYRFAAYERALAAAGKTR
jgi:DUF971 family protein